MSGFSADWLARRESADQAARDPGLVATLAAWARTKRGLRILDLGSGTGANLRALAPHLGEGQEWLLLDRDAELLARIRVAMTSWAHREGFRLAGRGDHLLVAGRAFSARVHWQRLDLASGAGLSQPTAVDLVTASALLDLVSATWLDGLVRTCRETGSAALFVLNYDGQVRWHPTLPLDAEVTACLNRHQRRNKGFGPALGPLAGARAAALFRGFGLHVEEASSDWTLAAAESKLQATLIEDWARAAEELETRGPPGLADWRAARLAEVERGVSRLSVGHLDLLALPTGA